MKNQDVRQAAANAGIRLWRIAEVLRIPDSSFSKKLRRELPLEEKEKIFGIIRDLSEGVG